MRYSRWYTVAYCLIVDVHCCCITVNDKTWHLFCCAYEIGSRFLCLYISEKHAPNCDQIGLPICYEIPIEHSGDIKEWFIFAYPRAFVKQVNYSYRSMNCRITTEVNFNLKERRFFCDNCLSIFSHLPNYQVVLLALHSVESKVD